MIEELPIYSEEAERAVMGCIINFPQDCCQIAVDELKSSDFFLNWARTLFGVVSAMWTHNLAIDTLTVHHEAKSKGFSDKWEEGDLITSLSDSVGSYHNRSSFAGYIRIIKAKAKSRKYQEIGLKLVALGLSEDDEDAKAIAVDSHIKALDEIGAGSKIEVMEGDKPWDDFAQMIGSPEADSASETLATGYGHFDSLVKIRGGHVVVIGAVQKHGKSTLALNICTRWWGQQIPGCICSLEMKIWDLQTLIMSNSTGITRDALEERKLSEERLDVLFKGISQAKKWPWAIFDRPNLKACEFRALARDRARKGDKFMILDYFQLLQSEGVSHQKRHEELEENMRLIKTTAMETNLAIVLVSQLNAKSVEGREGNKPSLANLRGTGAIAQDADVIMLLYEANPENGRDGMRSITGDITNRRGAKEEIQWLFDGNRARFLETI